jgi:hypothetical protein
MTTMGEGIGRWAAGLSEADIAESVRERSALQRASIVAAARAGEREAAPWPPGSASGSLVV